MSLPVPWLPGRPTWLAAWDAAWRIAGERVRDPLPCVSGGRHFVDAAYSGNIFQWDSCFNAFWARYAQGSLPHDAHPMSALDNFYALQQPDGAIAREYGPDGVAIQNKVANQDNAGTPPWARHDAFMNPPLLSWAEWEYYNHTGDDSRLARVLPKLAAYFDWYTTNRSRESGHLWSSTFGCGMDNLPRPDAHGWIDLTAQAALDCQHLANIALHVGDQDIASNCAANNLALKELINDTMWDEFRSCYGDIDDMGLVCGPMHLGTYWTLAAEVATRDRAGKLLRELATYRTFARNVQLPTLAASEHDYHRDGGYWRGGVWAPTTYMALRGMASYGAHIQAHTIAVNHLNAVAHVLEQTGTIWEYYQPERALPGPEARRDFCGWSALGPIAMLIEFVLGIRVDGALGEIDWRLLFEEEHGIENLKVGDATVMLCAGYDGRRWKVNAETDKPVTLRIHAASGVRIVELEPGKPLSS